MSVLFKTDIRNIDKIYSNKKAINTMVNCLPKIYYMKKILLIIVN